MCISKKSLMVSFVLCILLIWITPVFAEEPLTVSQAIQMALKENPDLKNLQAEVEQAKVGLAGYHDQLKLQVNIAGDIEYTYLDDLNGQLHLLPSLNWQLNPATRLQMNLVGINWPSERNGIPNPLYNSIKLTRTLFGGDQVWQAGLDARQFECLTKEVQLKQQQDAVSYQVIKGYYDVIKSMKMVEVQKEALKRSEEYLVQTEAFHEAGMVAKLDYLNAQVQFNQDQFALKRVEDGLALAKMNFNLLIGAPLETQFNFVTDFELMALPWTEAEAIQIVSKGSLQIEVYEQQLQLKREEEQRLKIKDLPTFKLESGYQWPDYKFDDGYANVKFTVNYSPTAPRSNQYSLQENRLEQEKILRTIEEEKVRLVLEIKTKYAHINNYLQELTIQAELIKKVKENLEIARVRYQAGLTAGNEILDSQISLLEVEKSYYETMVNYQLIVTELFQLLGKTF